MKELILILILISCSSVEYKKFAKSDHYDGERFFNSIKIRKPSSLDSTKNMIFSKNKSWPSHDVKTCFEETYDNILPVGKISTTIINHSTALIRIGKINVLTDPVWSNRAGPLTWLGSKRVHKPAIVLTKLPRIDYVLISHNHYDHLDLEAVQSIHKKFAPVFIVPLGVGSLLESVGITTYKELDWWQHYQSQKKVKITLTPSQHNSGRSSNDYNKSLWGSFVIEHRGKKVLFVADSGYSSHFKTIQKKFKKFDMALLPIGGYKPVETMGPLHMSPKQTVQVFKDVRAKNAIALHFGTFPSSSEDYKEPQRDLARALKEKRLSKDRFIIPCMGQTYYR